MSLQPTFTTLDGRAIEVIDTDKPDNGNGSETLEICYSENLGQPCWHTLSLEDIQEWAKTEAYAPEIDFNNYEEFEYWYIHEFNWFDTESESDIAKLLHWALDNNKGIKQ